jgi:hypothetical protein
MSHAKRLAAVLLATALAAMAPLFSAGARASDHDEFDATLQAAFRPANEKWPISLGFAYPDAGSGAAADWTVEVLSPRGEVVTRKSGTTPLVDGHGQVDTDWNGKDSSGRPVAPGYYTVRMRASPSNPAGRASAAATDQVEQSHDVLVGEVRPAQTPRFRALGVGAQSLRAMPRLRGPGFNRPRLLSLPAANDLPYTIYYGNLHAQTNHSDGGTDVAHCSHAETPQQGQAGPFDAYEMMRIKANADFLLASEHNHLYDGSSRENPSADVAQAIALFRSGLKTASDYRRDHPGFLALYGLEWGVIEGGGHLNLINPDGLANWESNADHELIGTIKTKKSDYADLYRVMKERGWIGQFNHAKPGQFRIGGEALAHDVNGAEVMVLAEVFNTSAFSSDVSEGDEEGSYFDKAWNTLLENGYRLAPSSNQDNHCANWGLTFTNRTGVLLKNNAALTRTTFLNALRARRAFATQDKSSQLVLTANSHLMGEEFTNTGKLKLKANYASATGRVAQRVQFFEGVPGRGGKVTAMDTDGGTHTFTPEAGEHFYYAVVTQEDGRKLWSAPVWVTQE